jgi:hypothetical protein
VEVEPVKGIHPKMQVNNNNMLRTKNNLSNKWNWAVIHQEIKVQIMESKVLIIQLTILIDESLIHFIIYNN